MKPFVDFSASLSQMRIERSLFLSANVMLMSDSSVTGLQSGWVPEELSEGALK